jgi:hypothetical protein
VSLHIVLARYAHQIEDISASMVVIPGFRKC